METFEQNPFETNRAEGGLRTLLIFTIVFQALGLLFGLLGLLQVSTQTGFTQASTIITPLLNLEMLIAAILMPLSGLTVTAVALRMPRFSTARPALEQSDVASQHAATTRAY